MKLVSINMKKLLFMMLLFNFLGLNAASIGIINNIDPNITPSARGLMGTLVVNVPNEQPMPEIFINTPRWGTIVELFTDMPIGQLAVMTLNQPQIQITGFVLALGGEDEDPESIHVYTLDQPVQGDETLWFSVQFDENGQWIVRSIFD